MAGAAVCHARGLTVSCRLWSASLPRAANLSGHHFVVLFLVGDGDLIAGLQVGEFGLLVVDQHFPVLLHVDSQVLGVFVCEDKFIFVGGDALDRALGFESQGWRDKRHENRQGEQRKNDLRESTHGSSSYRYMGKVTFELALSR